MNQTKNFDFIFRPKLFKEYIGQKNITQQMKIFIKAALFRKTALDHLLIFGQPGLGKTTLANIIANELGVFLKSTSGPVLEKAGDLAAILTNLDDNNILFIDEIHRLPPIVEEILYSAMEDFKIDIMTGEGVGARCIKIELKPFTLIGATTKIGALTSPLRDRFGIVQRLEFYSVIDLKKIILQSASILDIKINEKSALIIAYRSRGTPRIANRLLRRIRDFANFYKYKSINEIITEKALKILNIDRKGLDYMDRKFLLTIINNFLGGPVGLENLSTVLGEEKKTIEDVIEPYLIKKGFLQRTSRGRIATSRAFLYFNKKINI